ncbi:hypothetical protein BRCH_00645c [Candidatus Burkholderia brachyanthoides]|nr:hypothetical protein BRCH_00645c [Candidatus Burkholderia brachyanthoides]
MIALIQRGRRADVRVERVTGAIDAGLFAMKLPLQDARNWPLLNCSINTVDYDADGAQVVAWGDVSHLATDTDDDSFRKRA